MLRKFRGGSEESVPGSFEEAEKEIQSAESVSTGVREEMQRWVPEEAKERKKQFQRP